MPIRFANCEALAGSSTGSIYLVMDEPMQASADWSYSFGRISEETRRRVSEAEADDPRRARLFGVDSYHVWFPHWYPALLFALAGAATLRLGRRFTLRAAIIATTVVAILLAIPAIL